MNWSRLTIQLSYGLSKLFFKFDKLGVMGSTAQLRLRFLLLVKLAAWPCRSGKTVWLLPASGDPPACRTPLPRIPDLLAAVQELFDGSALRFNAKAVVALLPG
jgi:hypothetical protein